MDIQLNGKRAFVCGSTQGIGKAAAWELASLGANVTLCARNKAKLQEVVASLPVSGSQRHSFVVADFAYPAQLKAALSTFVSESAEPVQVLVNNTGGPPAGTALDAGPEAFLKGFEAHLLCNQHLVQAFAPQMKKAGYGRIINVISTSVKVPIQGLGVSNTIRGAVASWAKTLATELAPDGITVNNVLPGFTSTGRLASLIETRAQKAGMEIDAYEAQMKASVPARRFATPEEVAAAIAFLASPAAAYINGINLPVDGGNTPCL